MKRLFAVKAGRWTRERRKVSTLSTGCKQNIKRERTF